MKALIKLFKAVPITTKEMKEPPRKLLEETLRRGFIFSPVVIANYPEQELIDLIKVIEKEIGLTPEQMNNTFQKSWENIAKSNFLDLMRKQLMHYFTTYGFEKMGIYNQDSVYVPSGELEIPLLTDDVKIVVIRGYTKEEIREKILGILNSGIALAGGTLTAVLEGVVFADITEADIDLIHNKEAKAALYDYFEIFPENPIDFLRYIIYKTTGETLVIKNDELYQAIQEKIVGRTDIAILFQKYRKKHGLERLAEIFYRFKILFLAFRANGNLKPIVNKIRRLATKHHKPMKEDFLNNITAMLKRDERIDEKILLEKLSKVNVFRKIRLAQVLNSKIHKKTNSILYNIRNGKSFATEEEAISNKEDAKKILAIILEQIVQSISKNVSGKKIFIPENILYALPATEKMFTGNLPSGSSIMVRKNMVFGIHWKNTARRIDLDLSLINATTKIGWDADFRSKDATILYSGDLTDAPKPIGAAELFYVRKQTRNTHLLFVNYFNFVARDPVSYKILVATDEPKNSDFSEKYMVDPNKVLCTVKSKMNLPQSLLGLVAVQPENCKFYFNESNLGKSIVVSNKPYTEHTRNYLFEYCENILTLNDLLEEAGATFTTNKEEADIDLSPETIEKDSFLELLAG